MAYRATTSALSDHEIEDNAERQQQETEALQAIYGDDFAVLMPGTSRLCLTFESQEPLLLEFTYGKGYPSQTSPVVHASTPWWTEQQDNALKAKTADIFAAAEGEVMLFEVVEWAKDNIIPTVTPKETVVVEKTKLMQGADVGEGCPSVKSAQALSLKVYASSVKAKPPKTKPAQPLLPAYTGPPIQHGDTITDRKSVFQAHVAQVRSFQDVQVMMSRLLEDRKIAKAAHNILAYRIVHSETGIVEQDNDDDGESAAGGRLSHLLELLNVAGVAVIVTRWYGGIHLGADRFKHINNAARSLLDREGLISRGESQTKKGRKKKKS